MAKAKPKAVEKVARDLTRDELAGELDLHPETVGRYDREGAPHERKGRANRYSAPEYRAWMAANGKTGKEGRPADAEGSADLEAAKLRKENALATKYELQVAREQGELVPLAEVKQWIGRHAVAFRNKLVGFAAGVTPHLEGRDAAERQGILESRLTDILNEFSDAVRELGGGTSPA